MLTWRRVGSRHMSLPYHIILTLKGFQPLIRDQYKLRPISDCTFPKLEEAKRCAERHHQKSRETANV